jgi:hypothetical protein
MLIVLQQMFFFYKSSYTMRQSMLNFKEINNINLGSHNSVFLNKYIHWKQ